MAQKKAPVETGAISKLASVNLLLLNRRLAYAGEHRAGHRYIAGGGTDYLRERERKSEYKGTEAG